MDASDVDHLRSFQGGIVYQETNNYVDRIKQLDTWRTIWFTRFDGGESVWVPDFPIER
jgi:hypothetical protein